MRKEDKSLLITKIEDTLKLYSAYYLTDAQGLNAEQVSDLRRKCSKQDIKMLVVKNTLLKKAFENLGIDVSQFGNSLKLNTALFLSNTKSSDCCNHRLRTSFLPSKAEVTNFRVLSRLYPRENNFFIKNGFCA